MITKKSKRAKLENKRKSIFMIGLVCATSLSLAAFEWKDITDDLTHRSKSIHQKKYDDLQEKPKVIVQNTTKQQNLKKTVQPSNNLKEVKTVKKGIKKKGVEKVEIPDEIKIDIPNNSFDGAKVKESSDELFQGIPTREAKFSDKNGGLPEYLENELNFPEVLLNNGSSAKAVVSFVIGKNGKVRDVKVINNAHPLAKKEAIRVVKNMPDWIPAKQGLDRVAVQMTLPINFNFGK